MAREHVGHADIVRFADERVNLKRDDAAELRRQANMLRDKLSDYLSEHPTFVLRKMLLSGSLAKGTALKSISDIDVGCYIDAAEAPGAISELIPWLAEKLRKAFPNFRPDQVTPKHYSVGVKFITTGNEVDIVPIFYDGDPLWRGNLVSQETGETLMTSIPMHLDFIRKRKAANDTHFAQLVRLIKYWAKLRKQEDEGFRFKSFMTELIVAHLADGGTQLDDYPEAMQAFFTFIATDNFRTSIEFSDYYQAGSCMKTGKPMRIWDPVNCENNVADLYTADNRDGIVDAAIDAGDAIDSALRSPTKGETIRFWQKVLGPSFSA
ncbi:nucleotidyltransferase [Mesorhizobium sp. M0320]|uniref:CBASS oligonucleotide cyclase n=1 Tax=Mesorhizobium sp. M0320 TaxID=2956936 RepID=UPI00333D1900